MRKKPSYSTVGSFLKSKDKDELVKVTWEDACSYSNEGLQAIINKEPELVDTFGKVVFSNRKICIVMTHDSRGESNDYIRVPKCLIRRIER